MNFHALDALPEDLKLRPNFVLWLHGGTEGKPEERLIFQPDATPANLDDSTTWSDFSSVRAALDGGEFEGIGFVMTPELGIVAVELRHVIDASTRDLSSRGRAVVDALNTYTEISPDGEGLLLLAVVPSDTSLPEEATSRSLDRLTTSLSWFPLTGQSLPFHTPPAMRARADQLRAFHARFIAAKV